MQNIITFLKTYWISVASAGVSAVMLGVFAWGFMSNDVVTKLNERAAFRDQISSITPKNEECIRIQKANATKFAEQYEAVLQVAETMNRYKPLMEGVFPTPSSSTAAFEFKDAYARAVVELVNQLEAGDLPNEEEKREAYEEIEEIKNRRAKEQKAAIERGETPPPTKRDDDDPMMRPDVRAAVKKASSIRMYASLAENRQSFHVSPIINSDTAPQEGSMWLAQAGLWVQQDIVDAIKGLNDRAAAALPEGEAHVEQMPVKRIEGIKIWGYWLTNSPPAVDFPALNTPNVVVPITSFTKKSSDDKFDVLRVSILLIVDQRHVLDVIDEFCTNRFFQLIYTEYVALQGQDQSAGFFYGSAPTVRLQLQFEVYMSRKALLPLMPEGIQRALGIKK